MTQDLRTGALVRGRLTVLPLLLLAGVLAQSGSSAAGASVARCGPRAAGTLAADSEVRVYVVGSAVYGCAAGANRSFKLGQRQICIATSRAGPVTVAGRLVAYGLERCGVDTGSTEVVVRRLTDGRQLHAVPATGPPPGPESFQSVDSLVVRADGAVAWIATASSIVGNRKLIEVRRADRRGTALLDSGSKIDVSSLRLHRSRLRWKHGGATRSATLQ